MLSLFSLDVITYACRVFLYLCNIYSPPLLTMAPMLYIYCSLQVVSGGVASNEYVRARLNEAVGKKGLQLVVPPRNLCTDNGEIAPCISSLFTNQGQLSALNRLTEFDYKAVLRSGY